MPSPLGEGQTDTLINRHNRGEVHYDASVGIGEMLAGTQRASVTWTTSQQSLSQPVAPNSRAHFILQF